MLKCINYNYNSSQINSAVFFVALFRMLSCKGEGKLSRAVYPPNSHTYILKVKFWMLIPLISKYLNEKMDQL